jgi:ABC-type oligopeptide transport system substrate-binding subunit
VLHPVFDPKIQEKYKNNSFCDQPAIIRLSWGADYPDPDNMLRVGLPEVALSEPRIHEKIEAARVMLDQAQRLEQYREADRILIKEAFVFPLIYGTANYLVSPRVQKFPLTLHWKDFIVEPDDAGC